MKKVTIIVLRNDMNKLSNYFKIKLADIKKNLTQVNDSDSLSKFSLVVIIFLDIFILFAIFQGLREHTNQLTSPEEYIPEICRDMIIHSDWQETNRLDKLSDIILSFDERYDYGEKIRSEKLHPICLPCVEKIDNLKKDKSIITLLKTRQQLNKELFDLQYTIDELKSSYNTYLLENIARQSSTKDFEVKRIRQELNEAITKYNTLLAQLQLINSKLNNDNSISNLWSELTKSQLDSKEKLKNDLRYLNFWFPVKKLMMQMIFLIPLFLLFFIWNSLSIKKSRGIQILISSHLLIISFIPIFLKIIEAIYDIIPKKLLTTIWNLLVALNLIAIWHYCIILIVIFFAIGLIYFIQKKIFSREKMIEKRISKGNCLQCNKKIPFGVNACPFCGFIQNQLCPACGNQTYIFGKYCKECGSLLTKQ